MYKKPYEWSVLEKYPKKYCFVLEDDKNPLEWYLTDCLYWPDDLADNVRKKDLVYITPPFVFYFKANFTKEKIMQYDCIENNSLGLVVNKRTKKLLEEYCPKDMQFFEADIQFKDVLSQGEYYVLNILHKVDAIDMEETDYYYDEDGYIHFDKTYFKENCMEGHWIARAQQRLSVILVSQEFKNLFRKHKIKGPIFWTDERAYCLHTPSYYHIIEFFDVNPDFALLRFQGALERDDTFQILSRKLHKIPLHMLDTLIEKVSDLSDEGKKRLEKIKVLVEELRQKQKGA
jgi:hypothetical protein